jgi:hypothetical protein
MPALVAGIYVFLESYVAREAWMAGTRSYAGAANVVVPVRCSTHHQPA